MIKLLLGDCLEEMKSIEDNSIDLVLCDLPYGTTKCKWDVVIDFDLLWNEYLRITKENSAILLFGSEPFASCLRLSNLKMYKYDLYWVKEAPVNFFQLKKRFGKTTENICVFYDKQPTFKPIMVEHKGKLVSNKTNKTHDSITSGSNKTKIKEYVDTGFRYPSDILKFNRIAKGKTIHPTEKPVELLEYLIKTFSNEGDLVLDNTMGSGSTGVACKNLNRNFIGIEKDEYYFNKAKERLL